MAIDTSIYGNIKPIQIDNPLESYAKFAQIQQAQNVNRLADFTYGEKQREVDQENALSGLYKSAMGEDGKIDRNKLFSGAASAGLGSKIPTLQEGFAKQDKATADVDKVKLDALTKRLEIAGQAFGHVRKSPTLENANSALDYLGSNGVYDAETIARYKQMVASNPAAIQQLADQAFTSVLSAKDQLAKTETRNTGGTTDTLMIDPVSGKVTVANSVRNTQSPDSVATERSAAAGRAVTMRGQNMTDARSREANAAGGSGGKAPSGYRWTNSGDLEAIPGGPGGKTATATEGERKAATLLKRLDFSEKQLSAALTENPDAAKPGLVANGLRSMGAESLANTVATGSARQRVESAQLDMLDAALTLGTGAAYTREQLEGYRKSYFPQIGDDDKAIADKQARVKNVIDAAKIAAGRAVAPAGPSKPNAGGPIKIAGADDYAKVPSGAEYIAPDGHVRRKP